MSWLWASFPDRGWGIADGPRQLTQVEASNKLLKWDEKGGRGRDCGGEEGMDNDLREKKRGEHCYSNFYRGYANSKLFNFTINFFLLIIEQWLI